VLLGAFGISCYLFSEVKKEESEEYPANKNALAMIPICFTGFALLVSIIGVFGITKCRNKCAMFLYISLAIICVIGFGAACITAGVWLGGGSVIPDGALDKDSIGNTLFQEVCNTRTNPDDPTETLKTVGQNIESNEVTNVDSFFDAAKNTIGDQAELTAEGLRELLSMCSYNKVVQDLIFGKDETSDAFTVNVVISICAITGFLALVYMVTIPLSCMVMKGNKNYA